MRSKECGFITELHGCICEEPKDDKEENDSMSTRPLAIWKVIEGSVLDVTPKGV